MMGSVEQQVPASPPWLAAQWWLDLFTEASPPLLRQARRWLAALPHLPTQIV